MKLKIPWTKAAVCLGSLGVLALILVHSPVGAQEAEAVLHIGDSSDATEGGSHQIFASLVGGEQCTTVTFENGGNLATIHQDAGGLIPGTSHLWPSNVLTLIDSDAGGTGNFANEPSGDTIVFLVGGTSFTIQLTQPASGVSFFYTSNGAVTLEAFDSGGNLVASAGDVANIPPFGPGDPTGLFATWTPLSVSVGSNTIDKIVIGGTIFATGIDDFRVCRIAANDQIVEIDIKPGSDTNSINLGSKGKVPVACLGSESMDATSIDPATVAVAGASVKLKGNGSPMSSLEDVNGDGYLDLVVHVDTECLELTEGDTEATLTGEMYDGTPICGTDTIRVVP